MMSAPSLATDSGKRGLGLEPELGEIDQRTGADIVNHHEIVP